MVVVGGVRPVGVQEVEETGRLRRVPLTDDGLEGGAVAGDELSQVVDGVQQCGIGGRRRRGRR